MELPAMAEYGLLEEDAGDSWGTVANLDVFFTNMYKYFYHKGLPAIVLSAACNLITLAFTIGFSTFLLAFVDWTALGTCQDELSCRPLHHYIISNPFAKPSFLQAITLLYFMLSIVFWVWRCFNVFHQIKEAVEMEKFYRERLGLSLRDLQTIHWNDVVAKFIQLQESGTYRVAIKDTLTAHDIVSRIMRRENYMIAFINKGLLDLRVPWWISQILSPGTGKHEQLFLTSSLEWSLHFCILQHMLNEQFRISSVFLKDVMGLQQRFILLGILHLICLPFMLIFMIFHFFLQNAQQFHSDKSYLGPRQWSPLALWTFREFNELPHVFEDRINRSYKPANEFMNLFHQPVVAIVARCIQYIAGAFVAVLLLVTVFNDSVLLYVGAGGYNLIWYTGIFSAIIAAARSLSPDEKDVKSTPESVMLQIVGCIHFYPDHWKGQAHTLEVREEFSELFQFKARLFFMECASEILEFIKNHTKHIDGVGDICAYGTFDFEKYGNDEFAAPVTGRAHPMDKPLHGKMEKSFISFKQQHPNWECDQAGRAMITRLGAFRGAQQLSREDALASVLRQSVFDPGCAAGRVPRAPIPLRQAHSDELEAKPETSQVPATMVQSMMPNTDRTPQAQLDPMTFARGLPNILRSVLNEQGIDYENDFYWLEKFRDARRQNQQEFEKGLSESIAQGGNSPSGPLPDLSWLRNNFSGTASIFAGGFPGHVNSSMTSSSTAWNPLASTNPHSNVNTFTHMQALQQRGARPPRGAVMPPRNGPPKSGGYAVLTPSGPPSESATGYMPPESHELDANDV